MYYNIKTIVITIEVSQLVQNSFFVFGYMQFFLLFIRAFGNFVKLS